MRSPTRSLRRAEGCSTRELPASLPSLPKAPPSLLPTRSLFRRACLALRAPRAWLARPVLPPTQASLAARPRVRLAVFLCSNTM
eukprot:1365425-Alexandrium_andersonii.AAC.1